MKRIIILFITLFFITNFNFAQKDKDVLNIKMSAARLKFLDEDYYGAFRTYRKLHENNSNDALLNFRMGECCVALDDMEEAIPLLEKAYELDSLVNKDLFLLLGQAHQYLGNIGKAIYAYYNYKTRLTPKQLERHQVNRLLRQCLTAKDLMKDPVNVKIKNLGASINSEFTDASPSITADGKTLIFTARRPDTKGGKIDPANDEYYDDIYISTRNNDTKTWNKATQVPGSINSEGHDANLSISPDGKKIYLYKNITGKTRSGDILVSTINDAGEWSMPKSLGANINTSYFESSACITADGNTLYFVSERDKDGYGSGDIYLSKREGGQWAKPQNLGPVINSIYDEIGVFIHPDGKTLFFSSNGHNTMGDHDIFMSVYEDDRWTRPVNLGYPINTTKDEIHFILTTDGKTAYISSSRDGGLGKTDIYKIDMSVYFQTYEKIDREIASALSGPAISILKGSVVDAVTSEPVKTNIIVKDIANNVDNIISSDEKGEYFIVLPADKKYELSVNKRGYKGLNVKFKLPKSKDASDTFVLVKHLFLNKK